jgi:hypothetical protein
MTQKSRNCFRISCFEVLFPELKASSVTWESLGIDKLYLIKNWVSKPWIRIGFQPKMLAPDPYQMNTDPKPCLKLNAYKLEQSNTKYCLKRQNYIRDN